MNGIYKQVKLSLTEQLLNVYNYSVSQKEILGKILVNYLDVKYSYKYLIQQKKKGKKPQEVQIDEEILSRESLNFDYEKKQRLLNTLSKELEQEYKFLKNWIQKNTNNDEMREENNLPIEDSSNETINNEFQIDIEEKQQQQQDYEGDDEEKDCRAVRRGEEPDPNNPGYSKDGFLLW